MGVLAEPPRIDLSHSGVPEAAWLPVLRALPGRRPGALFASASRLVVVTPHPDDETLGVGGIIAATAGTGLPVTVVSVTDGEAAMEVSGLGALRRGELAAALGHLAPGAELISVGLPDGDVARHVDELRACLDGVLRRDDVVLGPLPDDGHPDHDAAGAVAVAAAAATGAPCWTYPVWAWHWHDPRTSRLTGGVRVALALPAWHAKQGAIECYGSQIRGGDPVVPPFAMPRYRRRCEVVVAA